MCCSIFTRCFFSTKVHPELGDVAAVRTGGLPVQDRLIVEVEQKIKSAFLETISVQPVPTRAIIVTLPLDRVDGEVLPIRLSHATPTDASPSDLTRGLTGSAERPIVAFFESASRAPYHGSVASLRSLISPAIAELPVLEQALVSASASALAPAPALMQNQLSSQPLFRSVVLQPPIPPLGSPMINVEAPLLREVVGSPLETPPTPYDLNTKFASTYCVSQDNSIGQNEVKEAVTCLSILRELHIKEEERKAGVKAIARAIVASIVESIVKNS